VEEPAADLRRSHDLRERKQIDGRYTVAMRSILQHPALSLAGTEGSGGVGVSRR